MAKKTLKKVVKSSKSAPQAKAAKKAAPAKKAVKKAAAKPEAKSKVKAVAKKASPAKAAPKKAAKKIVKPQPKKAVKPVVKAAKPAARKEVKSAKPVAKPVVKAVAKEVKPVAKPIAKPIAKPVLKAAKKEVKPIVKKEKPAPVVKEVKREVKPVKQKPIAKPEPVKLVAPPPPPVNPLPKKIEKPVIKPIIPVNTDNRSRYSDEELQEFRELITNKLETARGELKYLQEQISRSSEMGDDSDARFKGLEDGTSTSEREYLSQMASRQIQYIGHLEKALVRIENKTYGICRETGKLISKERLRAVPHATLSIEAKQGKG